MSDLNNKSSDLDNNNNNDKFKFLVPIAVVLIGGLLYSLNQSIDFNSYIEKALLKINDLGPYGYVYFSAVS